MPNIIFPVLMKRNAEGLIVRVIVPDLSIDVSRIVSDRVSEETSQELAPIFDEAQIAIINDYLYELRDEQVVTPILTEYLQDFVNRNNLTNIHCKDIQEWHVRKEPNISYQWLEISVETRNTYRCGSRFVSPIVTISFLGTLGLGEYFGYITDVVNDIPKKVALASISTNIFSQLVDYYASHTSENVSRMLEKCCLSKMPQSDYKLQKDFETQPSSSKYAYGLAAIYIAIQIFNNIVNFKSTYSNLIRQYDLAYQSGDIEMDYNKFMTMAKAVFFVDSIWGFIIPLNLALTVVPSLESLSKKIFSACFSRRNQISRSIPSEKHQEVVKIQVNDSKHDINQKKENRSYLSTLSIFSDSSSTMPLINNSVKPSTEPRRSQCVLM